MIRGRGAKIDQNQPAIVIELRRRGCSVQSLAELGDGVPDLLVYKAPHLYLFEIKNPTMPPSKRRLTDDEIEWHKNWAGPVYTVETVEQAWQIITA